VWDKMLKKAGDHAYFFVRVILKMLDITDRGGQLIKATIYQMLILIYM